MAWVTDKPCNCEHGLWNPQCLKHGLSKDDSRLDYLVPEYEARRNNLTSYLRRV